jgi:hypothetical protein
MVRWPALMGVLLVVLLASCSDKASEPASKPPVIKVGDCFNGASARPIDCNQNHTAQTVYVSAEPPTKTPADLSPCREAEAKFLGQDFHTRLDVQLWVPEDSSWYRCDVLLRSSTHAESGYQVLTESLKKTLRKGVPVDLQACLAVKYDAAVDQPYVPCDKPHISQELVVAPAIGTNDEGFPDDVSDRATRACNATASASDQLVEGHHVAAFFPENRDAWSTGERTADCWVSATRGQLPAVTTKTR